MFLAKIKLISSILFILFITNIWGQTDLDPSSFNQSLQPSKDLSYAVGQMMMVGFKGPVINENSEIVQEIKNFHISGVILFLEKSNKSKTGVSPESNIVNPTQLKKLTDDLQLYAKKYNDYPLFVAVNQEGGLINTLKKEQGFKIDDDPSQFQLGQTKNQNYIFEKTLKRAILLKEMGINLDLAPVADLNINPKNPAIAKYQRSFGKDPEKVTEDLLSAIKAYKQAKVFCTLKHFPGLGSASHNTDFKPADVTNTWQNIELKPYQNLIRLHQACEFIMTSHIINKNLDENGLPVSLSKKVVTDLLIEKLHFSGLIITDDMDAKAIRQNIPIEIAIKKSVLAGNNIILYGDTLDTSQNNGNILFDTLKNLAQTNSEAKNNIINSYHKIMLVKQKFLNNAQP